MCLDTQTLQLRRTSGNTCGGIWAWSPSNNGIGNFSARLWIEVMRLWRARPLRLFLFAGIIKELFLFFIMCLHVRMPHRYHPDRCAKTVELAGNLPWISRNSLHKAIQNSAGISASPCLPPSPNLCLPLVRFRPLP